MIQELEERKIEIAKAFNNKSKDGINMIVEACAKVNEEPTRQIAEFFKSQKHNLSLEVIGDYLGSESKEHTEWARKEKNAIKNKTPAPEEVFGTEERIREVLTSQMDFSKKEFVPAMRDFLQEFKLPGGSQKIDRLVESFANEYIKQSSSHEHIANKDASYILAYQVIMLQTSLHNPAIKESDRMSFDELKRNLKGLNNKENFSKDYLKGIYKDVKSHAFKENTKYASFGLSSDSLHKDKIYEALKERSGGELIKLIPHWKDKGIEIKLEKNVKADNGQVNLVINDVKTGAKARIEIHKPKNSTERINIQALYFNGDDKQHQASLKLAAELAVSFKPNGLSISMDPRYQYETEDIEKVYNKAIEGYGGRIINSEQEFVREFLKESVDIYIKHKNAQLSNTNPNANVDMKNFVKQDINALLSTLKRNTEISQNDKSYDKKIDVLVDSFRNNLDEFVDKMDRKISEDRISILAQKAEEGNKGIIVEKDQDDNLTSIYEDVDHLKEMKKGVISKTAHRIQDILKKQNSSNKSTEQKITDDQIKSLIQKVIVHPKKANEIIDRVFPKNNLKIKDTIKQSKNRINQLKDESLVEAAHNSDFMKISNKLKEDPDIIKQKDTGWKKVADLFRKIGISRLADFFDKKNEKSKVTSLAKDISLDKDVVLSSDLNNKSNKQSYAEKVIKNKVHVNNRKSSYHRI